MACVYASTYYLEPVSGGPVVVDFAVISRRHNPIFGSTYLEIKGGDWEMAKTDENGQQKQGCSGTVRVAVCHFGQLFQHRSSRKSQGDDEYQSATTNCRWKWG